jgi:hypothetical protein
MESELSSFMVALLVLDTAGDCSVLCHMVITGDFIAVYFSNTFLRKSCLSMKKKS